MQTASASNVADICFLIVKGFDMSIIRMVVAFLALLLATSSVVAGVVVTEIQSQRFQNHVFLFEGTKIVIEPREKAIIRDECNLTQRDVFTTTKSVHRY